MADEDAFLAAIRERPDDETLRLVYADWLEERNDPRHRLIRLETELRRLPIYAEEYHRRKPERARLRRGIDAGWLSQMGYQPTHRPMFTELPTATADRWRLAAEFIELWHKPLRAGDGYTEAELTAAEARLGRRLPRALREWYAFAGRRRNIWSLQDRLVIPERLRFTETDHLIIRRENQNFTRWYIRACDMEESDPPVYQEGDNREFDVRQVSPTLTAFALFVLVDEGMLSTKAIRCLIYPPSQEERPRLLDGLKRCALPPCNWFSDPMSFWEGGDLILVHMAGEDWFAAARTQVAYQELVQRTGGRLEQF